MAEKFFSYRGKPLVRKGKMIYYGDMSDPYVVMMQVLSVKEKDDLKLADRVMIQMLSTDETLPITERVIKKSEKHGLYQALDIASIWLKRALQE